MELSGGLLDMASLGHKGEIWTGERLEHHLYSDANGRRGDREAYTERGAGPGESPREYQVQVQEKESGKEGPLSVAHNTSSLTSLETDNLVCFPSALKLPGLSRNSP